MQLVREFEELLTRCGTRVLRSEEARMLIGVDVSRSVQLHVSQLVGQLRLHALHVLHGQLDGLAGPGDCLMMMTDGFLEGRFPVDGFPK